MKLDPQWKQSWRWFSMHALALQTAATLAWLQVPDDLRNSIPKEWQVGIAITIFVAGWIGRVIQQPSAK